MKNALIGVLAVACICLCWLHFGWVNLTDSLLATNAKLLATPHPVHDAQITVWRAVDTGKVTIMVNGTFPHVYERFCVRT